MSWIAFPFSVHSFYKRGINWHCGKLHLLSFLREDFQWDLGCHKVGVDGSCERTGGEVHMRLDDSYVSGLGGFQISLRSSNGHVLEVAVTMVRETELWVCGLLTHFILAIRKVFTEFMFNVKLWVCGLPLTPSSSGFLTGISPAPILPPTALTADLLLCFSSLTLEHWSFSSSQVVQSVGLGEDTWLTRGWLERRLYVVFGINF